MAWSSALHTDCQHPGRWYESFVSSPAMPQPQRLCVGSAGCFPLPSVKRSSSRVLPGSGSSIVGRTVGNWIPKPKTLTH
eukprot:3273538-Amphidinium_carterae.2